MMNPFELRHDAVVVDTQDDLLRLTSRWPVAEQAAYFRESWLPYCATAGSTYKATDLHRR